MTFGTLAAAPHRTKQEFVYRTLREAILRCELQPGERLVIDDLARRLNVSIIPVREALQLLQAESLVQVVPHVGTSVTPVSRDQRLSANRPGRTVPSGVCWLKNPTPPMHAV